MTQSKTTAQALLEEYWDFTIPISPEEFAKKLGLKIDLSNDMDTKSGCLDAEHRIIHVNATDSEERQRFTIAHELGHFCLGHGSSLRDTTKANWYAVNPEHEKEANQFAADLLMPAIAIKAMVERKNVKDPVILREAFGVSSQALYYRLKNLGYFL